VIEVASPDEYINSFIRDFLEAEEDVIPAVAAANIVATLRETSPEVLTAWLEARAESILREQITRVIGSRRARARAHAVAGAFARAAKEFEQTGDVAAMSPFDQRYVVDGMDTQRRVAEMTAADCLFVADRYEVSANTSRMLAAFHRAVASRVGDGTVSSVFTESEYDRLMRSIVKAPVTIPA